MHPVTDLGESSSNPEGQQANTSSTWLHTKLQVVDYDNTKKYVRQFDYRGIFSMF